MQRNVPRPSHPLPPLPGPAPAPAPVPAPVASAGQGGHQACASCKHQRKKCSESCELAPYFPAERTREFGLVQKVYGVSNLTKLVKANESVASRVRCAETLTWEATWRDIDPTTGCYSEVMQLREENAILRDVIGRSGLRLSIELPQPYRSPVQQPRFYGANGNTCSSSNSGRNLILEGINNNNGGRNLIHEGINNNIGGGGINNSNGDMHAPQQRMNHLVNSGNLIIAYHNLQPPPYMTRPGFQGDNGGSEFYP